MFWKIPHKIKIYEALGAIADNRLEISSSGVKLYSSSRNKFYSIVYDSKTNSIMCNDNASYFEETLGYPAIAYLMEVGEIDYNKLYSQALKNIYWKELNSKYDKNKGKGVPNYNFDKVVEEIQILLEKKEINIVGFNDYVEKVMQQIIKKKFKILGDKKHPPSGY